MWRSPILAGGAVEAKAVRKVGVRPLAEGT
jgi:hypothetical protein